MNWGLCLGTGGAVASSGSTSMAGDRGLVGLCAVGDCFSNSIANFVVSRVVGVESGAESMGAMTPISKGVDFVEP